jgi:hypothetical protein
MKIKRMDLSEFKEKGLLQEVNRQFFHPLGLALEMVYDDEKDEISFGGVWDFRDDPEGMIFDLSIQLSAEAEQNVRSLREAHEMARLERFGWVIQPIVEPKTTPQPIGTDT